VRTKDEFDFDDDGRVSDYTGFIGISIDFEAISYIRNNSNIDCIIIIP
jgi:hypothetical protein